MRVYSKSCYCSSYRTCCGRMSQNKLHEVIAQLSKSPESNASEQYLEQLQKSINFAIQSLSPCDELERRINNTDKVTIKFIATSLHALKQLAYINRDDSLDSLISIQQQQKIKSLLHMIFCIGVVPSLHKGVNTLLANKTTQLHLKHLEDLSLGESYNMTCDVVRSVLQLLKVPNFRSLVLVHLGDLMAILLQLVHAGEFKKPIKSEPGISKPGEEKNLKEFVMTEEWYEILVKDREEFRIAYDKLVEDVYKPLVIKELLILLAPTPSAETGREITPPKSLRRAISQQLSSYVTRADGVSLLMRALCDSSSDAVDWKKVDTIAKLVSTLQGNLTVNEFYSLIAPQILSLLRGTESYCLPVARKCIKNIYEYDAIICGKYIVDKMFEPFLICTRTVDLESFGNAIVGEEELSDSVDAIVKCFAPGSEESSLSFKALTKIVKILFRLHMKVADSAYQHRAVLRDLLIRYLHSYTDLGKLTEIYNALIFDEPHEDMLEMNEALEFGFGSSGGVEVVKRSVPDNPSLTDCRIELESEVAGDCMLDLLSHNEEYSKRLLTNLFVALLSSMSEWRDQSIGSQAASQDLLNADELIAFVVRKSQKRLIAVKLLAVLAENVRVGESIRENPLIVLEFVEKALKKSAATVSEGVGNVEADEWNDEGDSYEDLLVTLAVVDVMTTDLKASSQGWDYCQPLLNPIKIIKDHCEDASVRISAEMLYDRIATRGAVGDGSSHRLKGEKLFKTKFHETRKTSDDGAARMAEGGSNAAKSEKDKALIVELDADDRDGTDLQTAIKEACSEDVATRGHGLIRLSKLIKRLDTETISKKEYVLTVLKQNLRHGDTYIYLAAINGLETLACIHTDVVLDLLSREFSDRKKDSELRMKIGEVLVRITRMLGDTVPRYKALLINTFLIGTRDEDEFVRASSLSNLGEVLQILRFGVGNILQEVYVCVESIAATDKSSVARRAAVLVVQLLLRGVSESDFMILESVIRDLYRTLKHIRDTDQDEVVRLQASLALSEIDRIVRDAFSKVPKLEKHVGILNLSR